jgi:hypothetical protein
MSKSNGGYEDAAPYYEKYDHPLWKQWMYRDLPSLGRGLGDFLAVQQFLEACRSRGPVPLDVYDAVAWSAIMPLSIESVADSSAPARFPDFTRGKWQTVRKRIYYGI